MAKTPAIENAFPLPLPSPSMNELAIVNKEGDPLKYEMAEALRQVRISAENARAAAVAIHGDATRTPPAQHIEASEHVFRITNPTLKVVDRTLERVDAELRALRQKTNAPATPNSALAAEIRSTLRGLTDKARRAEVAKALGGPDGDSIVGSILSGPAILSGMAQLEIDHTREQWRRKRLPAECTRIDELEKARVHLERGGNLLVSYSTKMADADIVQAAKTSRDKANAAVAAAMLH